MIDLMTLHFFCPLYRIIHRSIDPLSTTPTMFSQSPRKTYPLGWGSPFYTAIERDSAIVRAKV